MLPVLMGIILNLVPPSTKTLANSITNLTSNLIGYFPAPSVYGIIYEATGGAKEKSRWGIITLQLMAFVTTGFLALSFLTRQAKTLRKSMKKKSIQ